LSSAVTVNDSVPVCLTWTSPVPASSMDVKPVTERV
jgi:hypothetical protein